MPRSNTKSKNGFTCWNCHKCYKFGTTWCDKCGADISESMTRDERAAMRESLKFSPDPKDADCSASFFNLSKTKLLIVEGNTLWH